MKTPRCPVCNKKIPFDKDSKEEPQRPPHFPFCSERCKMVDLGRWFDHRYTISRELNPIDDDSTDLLPEAEDPFTGD